MPILAQTIIDRVAAALDSEGSARYTFAQDYKFAINSSIEWVCSVFNQAFAQNKLSPENLRELTKVKIWQLNEFSRFSYNKADTGGALWSVLAIYPNPQVYPVKIIPAVPYKDKSVFWPNLSYVSANGSAKRLTFEEWNTNKKNVFLPGSVLLSNVAEYAYLDFADYSSSNYSNPVNAEIEIRPTPPNKLVALAYLKYPTQITASTDTVEFPETLTQLIADKTVNFISWKQGDGTTANLVTQKDIQMLVSLMS